MGRRGPQPKGEYAGQSAVFSTRIRPELKAALESAAEDSGRSLSQEVAHRLRRTFVEDERMADAFGSRRNYLVVRMIGLAMQASKIYGDDQAADWLDDPASFDAAVTMANVILKALRPSGKPTMRVPRKILASTYGSTAAILLKDVQGADPSEPLNRSRQHRVFKGLKSGFAGLLKTELGTVLTRPEIVAGTDGLPQVKRKSASRRKVK
jgi:hypothetical protein